MTLKCTHPYPTGRRCPHCGEDFRPWLTDLLDDLKMAAVWTGALMGFSLVFLAAIEVAYGCP